MRTPRIALRAAWRKATREEQRETLMLVARTFDDPHAAAKFIGNYCVEELGLSLADSQRFADLARETCRASKGQRPAAPRRSPRRDQTHDQTRKTIKPQPPIFRQPEQPAVKQSHSDPMRPRVEVHYEPIDHEHVMREPLSPRELVARAAHIPGELARQLPDESILALAPTFARAHKKGAI